MVDQMLEDNGATSGLSNSTTSVALDVENGAHSFSIEQKGALPSYAQSITWVGFICHSPVTRSLVHFFPSAGSITAPYSANCKLTLLGANGAKKSLQIDGARLSHPDGLKVEDVFPEISDGVPLLGMEVELSTGQQRVDMSGSSALIEIVTGGQSVKYTPKCLMEVRKPHQVKLPRNITGHSDSPSDMPETHRGSANTAGPIEATGLAVKDSFTQSSVVVINRSQQAVHPTVRLIPDGNCSSEGVRVPCDSILPGATDEIQVDDRLLNRLEGVDAGFGLVRACPLTVQLPAVELMQACAMFLVSRDVLTKRVTAVQSLRILEDN